jgi:hypothetical protein
VAEVITGTAIADVPITAMPVLPGICALVIVVALWALYFASADELVDRHLGNSSNPILAGGDVLQLAQRKIDELRDQIESHRELSTSLTFDPNEESGT